MIKKLKRAFGHIRSIIVNPRRYFTKIVADGNMEEAMFKAFLYGLAGGVLVFVINLLTGASFTIGSLFSALIITPVIAVGVLFIMGGLMMLVSEITGGERDWEIAIKGLASVFFMYPVILGLNALAFNCVSMWVISILVDAYVLFLFYNIALYCMRGKRGNVLLVIGIIALFLLTVYATDYRMGWFVIKNNSAAFACL
ncbi:MAG: hypothetical protein IKA08_04555 [Alphaproteobacteria bacterium]|nr:hypothetical protein [Alphaproteobacteria bacterium]